MRWCLCFFVSIFFLIHVAAWAAPLTDQEAHLVDFFYELPEPRSLLSPLSDSEREFLFKMHEYETSKLRASVKGLFVLLQSLRASSVDDFNWTQLEGSYDRVLVLLDQYEQTPFSSSKKWHGLASSRNSAFRRFCREAAAFVSALSVQRQAAGSRMPDLKRYREVLRRSLILLLNSRSSIRILSNFYGTARSDGFQPLFSESLHLGLAKVSSTKVQGQGFQEAREAGLFESEEPILHLWVMNHRDIYLDPLFVGEVMRLSGCGVGCHYVVDPERYFGGTKPKISSRMLDLPDFLNVGDGKGDALRKLKDLMSDGRSHRAVIFPEGTTSLIGDTARLDPYFVGFFINGLLRSKIKFRLHIAASDISVQIRADFYERFGQIFHRPKREVIVRYIRSIHSEDLPKNFRGEKAEDFSDRILLDLIRAQNHSGVGFFGQIHEQAMLEELIGFVQRQSSRNKRVCREVLAGLQEST